MVKKKQVVSYDKVILKKIWLFTKILLKTQVKKQ